MLYRVRNGNDGTAGYRSVHEFGEGAGVECAGAHAQYELGSSQPGWAEGDPQEWWGATVSAVREAARQVPHEEITAIGLSGQMHGVVPVDEQGMPTYNALLWADERAIAELDAYHALPEALRQRLANPLVPGMAGPLLCWLMHHEAAVYEKTRWALQMGRASR